MRVDRSWARFPGGAAMVAAVGLLACSASPSGNGPSGIGPASRGRPGAEPSPAPTRGPALLVDAPAPRPERQPMLLGDGRAPMGDAGPTHAELERHASALLSRLGPEYSAVVERPFVVVGNGGPRAVAAAAEGTVRFAVTRLERQFFRKAPQRVLEVWLFRDAATYEKGVRDQTGEDPGTPYGFYSSRRGGLFMNIATGGGTLVHEIVHPYVEADLPDAPTWVNEGLGSLFEQSADRGGAIVGLPNWRLGGLQDAIRADALRTFHGLVHTSTDTFYDDDAGTNYAQARYLMLWLQEQGKLEAFYRSLHQGLASDPSGWTSLVAALGEKDMAAFQERWELWVMGLRFP